MRFGFVGTHGQAAPLGGVVHPLHVHHRPEQAHVVVDSAKRLHALKQLGKQTGGHMTAADQRPGAWVWPHLYGIVQGGAGWMQRQVLEGFDPRSLPAALLRPLNGQHVIRKLLSENQAGRVGLGLACCAAVKEQICRLRCRRGTDRGAEKEADGTEAQQARDRGDVRQCYQQRERFN